jgi:DNA-binding NtrC family response regulator
MQEVDGFRRDILLSSADWQSRTLILAELQERGYEVMAVPGLAYAIRAVLKGHVDPPLVILDVHGDESATPEKVQGLLTLLPGRPVLLLTGVYDASRWEPLRAQVARFMRRPIRVGDVVREVQRLLPQHP